jgi:hypothetical protein
MKLMFGGGFSLKTPALKGSGASEVCFDGLQSKLKKNPGN